MAPQKFEINQRVRLIEDVVCASQTATGYGGSIGTIKGCIRSRKHKYCYQVQFPDSVAGMIHGIPESKLEILT
ncbi:hypothetical protein H0H81_011061 [Sphagnurus paluster]|uniref:Uncharacterized protein n=1 Tax=Sphagnurus paluster TaxID=117069 RepID=A0A9P7K567_9AGAR|nr:hypothetical protein H0H81_011061 [Sphagnurus paluster]